MKKLVIIIFCSITYIFSQTIDDVIKGPITGRTYTPDAGKYYVSSTLGFISSVSSFDDNGDEITYNLLLEGIAELTLFTSILNISAGYSLTEAQGLFATIPIIAKQELIANPSIGYEEAVTNLSGKTGLGDITVGGWCQISKNQNNKTLATASYTLTTGSSPEDVGKSNFSSTGSGHTSIEIGINADYFNAYNILVSARGEYTLNQKGEFSSKGISWSEKDANQISFNGRVSMLAAPQLSIGFNFEYLSAGTSEYDGETIDGSDYNSLILTPIVGYQMATGSTKVNITGSYLLNIFGKNYPILDGVGIGADIFF